LCLSRSLKSATDQITAGILDAETIEAAMVEALQEADRIEYVAIVDRAFRPLERVEIGNTILLVAAWVGKPRLIDNLWI